MPQSGMKIRAARISILTATSLALVKLVAGIFTGSMAILSSAIDSLLDIVMSAVNYFAIRQAVQPADEKHPFGHGKFETVATIVQAQLIAVSGIWIIYESVRRLFDGRHLTHLGGGTTVLLVSSVASLLISRYLKRVAAKTESSALKADSLHFSMDVYTNLALGLGLLAVRFLGAAWLDPLLSIAVALYILKEALELVRSAMRDILDENLPQPVINEIERLIKENGSHVVDYHELRTRRAGSQKLITFHLKVCGHLSVEEGHLIADRLEKSIENEIIGSDVTIHIEPCGVSECVDHSTCSRPDRGENPPPPSAPNS